MNKLTIFLLMTALMICTIQKTSAMDKTAKPKREVKVATFSQQFPYSRFLADFATADFEIKGIKGDNCSIEIFYSEDYVNEASFNFEKGRLWLEAPKNNSVKVHEVKVLLPYSTSIELDLVDGNAFISDFDTAKSLVLNLTNGDAIVQNSSNINRIEFQTVNGDIVLANMQTLNNLSLSSINGDFLIFQTGVTGSIAVSTTNGDGRIDKVNAGKMAFATINGDIEIGNSYANKADISTISGDLLLSKNVFEDYNFSTVSGSSTIVDKLETIGYETENAVGSY